MTNAALKQNPPNALIDITEHASDFLWCWFAIMAVCFIIMIVLNFLQPRGQRVFHHIAVAILATSTIAYFSLASDLGSTPIVVEYRCEGCTRAIWYVRYIMYTITYPLTLLLLLLGTGVALSDLFITLFMSIVMIDSLLIGALVHSSYKWGYYAFSLVALIWLWYQLLTQIPKAALSISSEVRSLYYKGAGLLSFVWLQYPICWALAEGSNKITPTGEMVYYGILDLLTIPIFLFFYTWAISRFDYSLWGLQSGKASMTHGGRAPPMSSTADPVARNSTAGRPSTVEAV